MGEHLKGKVAVVTGGGRGLGRAICLCLADEGARVVVNDLGTTSDGTGKNDASAAEEVVNEIKNQGGQAAANYDSVTTWEGGERIIKTAVDNFGTIDILVNNAGILRDRMIFNMTEEEWDMVVKVHLYGTFYCTRHAVPIMREKRGGRLIFMSSNAVQGITPGQPNYSSAKGGILALSTNCSRALGKYGITSNAIFPHADTRMTLTEAAIKERQSKGLAPAGNRDPGVVAPMVAYLATDEAANINGQVIEVSGNQIDLLCWPPYPVKTIFSRGELWTVDNLIKDIPETIAKDLVNPAPPQPPK